MPCDRILVIEGAARRLGMTVVVDSHEAAGYDAPSLEDDMQVVSDVFGHRPEQEVACLV